MLYPHPPIASIMQRLICESDIRCETPETITSATLVQTSALTATITPDHCDCSGNYRQHVDSRNENRADSGHIRQLVTEEQDSRGRSMERKAVGEETGDVEKIALMGFEGVVPRHRLEGKRKSVGREDSNIR